MNLTLRRRPVGVFWKDTMRHASACRATTRVIRPLGEILLSVSPGNKTEPADSTKTTSGVMGRRVFG